jgi:putative (di)nucleoside polyphosphate hydrolase
LLKLTGKENDIKLDTHSDVEFDDWQWVDYWHPIEAMPQVHSHLC